MCRRVRRVLAGPRVQPGDIDNDIGLLERTLAALGRPVWKVTPEDIDRVVGDLAVKGRATSTRREYVQIFKGFHRFLQARKSAEIEAAFGVRLVCPVDEFNASRHVGDDSPALLPPPTPERVGEFFDFMKQRIATARKYGPAVRDYAMFRSLYHAGLRSEEASLLEKPNLHFTRGPFGKLHVRFGKGAHTSGPRPRWVPMLDGLDLMLRWFLEDVRPKFPDSPVLFADESGGSLHRGTIPNRLRYLMELEGRPPAERFSPHALRRACATHNYERGVDLVAIQQVLGHWTVSSTMRYYMLTLRSGSRRWSGPPRRTPPRTATDPPTPSWHSSTVCRLRRSPTAGRCRHDGSRPPPQHNGRVRIRGLMPRSA
ncbi:site-specific integrase [Streptomyces sp. NPDC050211]|uniref:tyrosine-type recombinase/integrase n=1 Tax=Streptomyces sp. NPDC050211 TaxID=3154932 RepID=UPI00343C1B8F